MYKLTYVLEKAGEYKTFEEAFTELYRRLNIDLENDNMSYQVLETMIWIEVPNSMSPMLFYDARDHACRIGLLKDGKINPDYNKKNPIIEGTINGGTEIVTCPECGSDNVEAVLPFDYVKQCNDCDYQFVSGRHN